MYTAELYGDEKVLHSPTARLLGMLEHKMEVAILGGILFRLQALGNMTLNLKT